MHYPKHIAIIPDGNRTRAKENGKDPIEGHLEGLSKGIELIKYTFAKTPIEIFTTRGLSTENLKKRSQKELDYLFVIYKQFAEEVNEFLQENKISFKRIGNHVGLPQDLIDYLRSQEAKHSYSDSPKKLVVAINYGGRDEITRAVEAIVHSRVLAEEVTEDLITQHCELGSLPNVELVIRTKGDMAQRTSGFMSRWIGYAELYFTAKKAPEFAPSDLEEALERYNSIYQHRNFGK